MNTVVPISRDDERLEAASRWVLKIDEGALSVSDKDALGLWLDENPRHREVLLEVAAVWDKTDALARLADFFPHEATPDRTPTVHGHRPWTQGVAVAASLIVLVVSAVFLLPRVETSIESDQPLPTQSAAYVTAIGEQKTVLLPDGSEVVLNTNSELSLTFTSSARVLYLARGEILVRVAKEDRPLSVVAVDQIVQAKGTEFSVEITDDQHVEVMVTEGRVVVGIQPKSAELPGATNFDADSFILPPVLAQLADNTLSAGEELVLGEADTVKKAVTADEIEVRLSWKDGRLIFRSERLEKALREMERYTTVEFIVLDESLNSTDLSGVFKTGEVERFLELLRTNFNITHKFDGENRILLSSL